MEKNTGKVREFCHPGKVGTLCKGGDFTLFRYDGVVVSVISYCFSSEVSFYRMNVCCFSSTPSEAKRNAGKQ